MYALALGPWLPLICSLCPQVILADQGGLWSSSNFSIVFGLETISIKYFIWIETCPGDSLGVGWEEKEPKRADSELMLG